MTTLDNYHLIKEAISHHFREKNILACFLPKVGAFGSGCHIHMSLWKDGVNITDDKNSQSGLSGESESFFAGIFNNFSALFHFLNPSNNSIRRVLPCHWVGAYKIWAHNNKEAPMRFCKTTKKNG
jgi:glutamine synthetase